MGLLGEQHAGRGQFQAGQDLLPQFAQVGFALGSSVVFGAGFWAGFGGCFSSGVNGRSRRRGSSLPICTLPGLGDDGPRNDWLGCWMRCRNGLDRRSSGCGLELGFCQEAQQQDLEPQAGIDAVAQLLLTAPELGLPVQQLCFADAAGQLW